MYGLDTKLAADGHIYIKIEKGMYGLKQTAVLAYDNLVKNLLTNSPHNWHMATCYQTDKVLLMCG